ncbi:hypothetical protein BJX65DRAFT_199159 [Aspergillus insuetus]
MSCDYIDLSGLPLALAATRHFPDLQPGHTPGHTRPFCGYDDFYTPYLFTFHAALFMGFLSPWLVGSFALLFGSWSWLALVLVLWSL